MIKHVKSLEEFEKETASGRIVVDFFATWCGPCQMLSPLLEELSGQIDIVKVDVDEASDIARKFAISSIPTLFLFENGNIVKKNVGFLNKVQLQNFIA